MSLTTRVGDELPSAHWRQQRVTTRATMIIAGIGAGGVYPGGMGGVGAADAEPIKVTPFLSYLKRKLGDVYGLRFPAGTRFRYVGPAP